jgi:hypothetical protein
VSVSALRGRPRVRPAVAARFGAAGAVGAGSGGFGGSGVPAPSELRLSSDPDTMAARLLTVHPIFTPGRSARRRFAIRFDSYL